MSGWTHEQLVERAGRWLLNTKRCKLVIVEPKPWVCLEHPDVIGWFSDGESIVVECKTSEADFFADRRKVWRRHSLGMGMYRYYLAPAGALRYVSDGSGWLEAHGRAVKVRLEAQARQVRDWASELALLLSRVSTGRNIALESEAS